MPGKLPRAICIIPPAPHLHQIASLTEFGHLLVGSTAGAARAVPMLLGSPLSCQQGSNKGAGWIFSSGEALIRRVFQVVYTPSDLHSRPGWLLVCFWHQAQRAWPGLPQLSTEKIKLIPSHMEVVCLEVMWTYSHVTKAAGVSKVFVVKSLV